MLDSGLSVIGGSYPHAVTRQGRPDFEPLPSVSAARLLTRVFRDRLRAGVFTGLISAAATAGVLVAFGMGQRHPFLAFNIAAHVLLSDQTRSVSRVHPLFTPVGILVHAAAVVVWSILLALIVGGRRPAAVVVATIAFVSMLFAVNTRVLPSALRPGYETVLSQGQLFFLYFTLAASLLIGTRLAQSARE